MVKYVEQEAAKYELCDRCMNVVTCTRSDNDCPIKRGLNNVPAVDDVELVKSGIWRYQTMSVPGGKGQTYSKWSCSNCHKKEKKRSPYCPNCGARMEEY